MALAVAGDCKIIYVNRFSYITTKTKRRYASFSYAKGIFAKDEDILLKILIHRGSIAGGSPIYKIRDNPFALKGGYNEKTTKRCLLPGNR